MPRRFRRSSHATSSPSRARARAGSRACLAFGSTSTTIPNLFAGLTPGGHNNSTKLWQSDLVVFFTLFMARSAWRRGNARSAGHNFTMSREIRKVPADWQHPKDSRGYYIPLHDGFNQRLADWDEENAKWQQGLRRNYFAQTWVAVDPEDAEKSFADWDGLRPEQKDFMPDWPTEQRTHLCMYETCTEGTPISPVCATPEECARWLADNGASAFGCMTATYEQWLATCRRGWALGLAFDAEHGMRSGVELNAETP